MITNKFAGIAANAASKAYLGYATARKAVKTAGRVAASGTKQAGRVILRGSKGAVSQAARGAAYAGRALKTGATKVAKKASGAISAHKQKVMKDIMNTKTYAKEYKKAYKNTRVISKGSTLAREAKEAAVKATKKKLRKRKFWGGVATTSAVMGVSALALNNADKISKGARDAYDYITGKVNNDN